MHFYWRFISKMLWNGSWWHFVCISSMTYTINTDFVCQIPLKYCYLHEDCIKFHPIICGGCVHFWIDCVKLFNIAHNIVSLYTGKFKIQIFIEQHEHKLSFANLIYVVWNDLAQYWDVSIEPRAVDIVEMLSFIWRALSLKQMRMVRK